MSSTASRRMTSFWFSYGNSTQLCCTFPNPYPVLRPYEIPCRIGAADFAGHRRWRRRRPRTLGSHARRGGVGSAARARHIVAGLPSAPITPRARTAPDARAVSHLHCGSGIGKGCSRRGLHTICMHIHKIRNHA